MRRRAAWAFAIVLCCVSCDAVRGIERSFLFHPPITGQTPQSESARAGIEPWWIETSGGERVEAWYVPAAHSPSPAVIYAHGNAELIDDCEPIAAAYHALGYAVLVPEYRGYGRSQGVPGEDTIVADFTAFYDRLAADPRIDRRRIAMHGRSLGGGVIGALSAQRRARAVILESTFTSVPDLASNWLVPSMWISDRFDTRASLARRSAPPLIFHGTRDMLVPFKHARELARVAPRSALIAVDAGHDDLPRTERDYWTPIREFLARALR